MRLIALALSSLIACSAALSQAQEPPGRVGRLAYAEGGVSMYQDPEQGWEQAYVNSPITSENSVWTQPGARAELRVGGTALRLDEDTQLDVSEIADDALEAGVARGTLNVRVRYKQGAERFAISTPHARFILEADGRYRIDADPDGNQSRLTVFSGTASMETSQGRVRVAPGQSIVVYGASSEYAFESAQDDAFDRWALERDNQWRDAASRRYVSTYMTGYEDLDGYGQWSQDPDYGALWFPARVASDWAPYRNGRWSYVRPWGWTWIDDEPGLRAVALRTLGLRSQPLGMGSRAARGASGLGARAGGMGWRRELERRRQSGRLERDRLVPARTVGAIRAVVSRQCKLPGPRQFRRAGSRAAGLARPRRRLAPHQPRPRDDRGATRCHARSPSGAAFDRRDRARRASPPAHDRARAGAAGLAAAQRADPPSRRAGPGRGFAFAASGRERRSRAGKPGRPAAEQPGAPRFLASPRACRAGSGARQPAAIPGDTTGRPLAWRPHRAESFGAPAGGGSGRSGQRESRRASRAVAARARQ